MTSITCSTISTGNAASIEAVIRERREIAVGQFRDASRNQAAGVSGRGPRYRWVHALAGRAFLA
jgi:hypothetical protein